MIRLLIAVTAMTMLNTPAPTIKQDDSASAFYRVSYVEVAESSRDVAVAAFRDYEAASRGRSGFSRFDLFEERGRPGHFAAVEAWSDNAAFENATGGRSALDAALEPIRVSDYDQRPYKALTVGGTPVVAGDAVIVIAHVDVSPSPEVPVLLAGYAEDSRREAGSVRFDVLQHTMRANHFTVIEAWTGPDTYRIHAEAAHTRRYRDRLGPFLGSPLDQRVYAAVR